MQFNNTIQSMQKLGGDVVKEGKSILKKKKKETKQNTLYNDFNYLVTASDSSVTLEFEFGGAEDYWAFVDEGVRGAGGYKGSGRMRGQGSPFKFGSKMPPRQPLINWIRNKPIKGRDKRGRFISNESLGFLIQRAIYQRGLTRTQFFSKPFTQELDKQMESITEAFANDLELALDTIIK
jgi:hypothetical protein|tara:strand:- start:1564 stop:2100 length:537 start_codon:yes stop_codon:yes gene_type:complete